MSPVTTATGTATASSPSAVWAPCATCWGQRRIYSNPNGEGLVPHACPDCLGMGERLVATTRGEA